MNIELLKNLVDYGVIALLVFMSFISFWFFIERIIFYKSIDLTKYKNKNVIFEFTLSITCENVTPK